MAFVRALPQGASLADLRGAYPDLFERLRPYGEALMRGPSPLSVGERELIAAYVSALNSCRWCHGVHSRVAAAFGIDQDLMGALLDERAAPRVAPGMRPLLAYVRKLTEAPARLVPADADAVYAAGWDDTALVHAVAVCAYFNMMNRLVEGTGIVGDPESYARAARGLVERGYRGTQGSRA